MQNIDHLTKELRSIGLSDKASLIYAAILELGVAFPSKISEVTKLNRSTVYKILTDLSVKGLVTELERNKKICYQIEKPARLVSFAKNQIRLAEERFERATKILPDIEGLFSLTPHKPRVRFFEGVPGIMHIYEDHVSETTPYEMLGFSHVEELMKFLPTGFIDGYVKKKQRIGITTRGLFPDTPFNLKYNKNIYRGVSKKILIETRYIPIKLFPYKADITIYGKNKVSIINFHEHTLIGIIIEDETIANMMRMIFNLAWKGVA